MGSGQFFVLEHPEYVNRSKWWWLNRAYDLGEKPYDDPPPQTPLRLRIFEGRSRPNVIAGDSGHLIVDPAVREVIERTGGDTVQFGRIDVLGKTGTKVVDGSCSRVLLSVGAGPRVSERG